MIWADSSLLNTTIKKPDQGANEDLCVTDMCYVVKRVNSPRGEEIKTVSQGYELVGLPKLNQN